MAKRQTILSTQSRIFDGYFHWTLGRQRMGLLVDGTGGTIVYEGGVDQFGDDIVKLELVYTDAWKNYQTPVSVLLQ